MDTAEQAKAIRQLKSKLREVIAKQNHDAAKWKEFDALKKAVMEIRYGGESA